MTSTKLEQKVTIVNLNLQINAGESVGDSYRLLRFYFVHGCITFKLFSSNTIALYLQPAGVLSYRILSNIFLKFNTRHVCYLNMSIFCSISIYYFNNGIITSSSQVNSYLLRLGSTDISFHINYGSSTLFSIIVFYRNSILLNCKIFVFVKSTVIQPMAANFRLLINHLLYKQGKVLKKWTYSCGWLLF